jgi:hypothetical protein
MVETTSSTAYLFPKKPTRTPKSEGKALKLYSNYFSIDFSEKETLGVNKYTVKFEPEIPDNARAMRKEVLKLCRDKIKEELEFYIDWGLCVFSLKKVAELPVYEAEHEGQKYTVKIDWV